MDPFKTHAIFAHKDPRLYHAQRSSSQASQAVHSNIFIKNNQNLSMHVNSDNPNNQSTITTVSTFPTCLFQPPWEAVWTAVDSAGENKSVLALGMEPKTLWLPEIRSNKHQRCPTAMLVSQFHRILCNNHKPSAHPGCPLKQGWSLHIDKTCRGKASLMTSVVGIIP